MKILHVLTSPRMEGTPRLVLDWLTLNSPEQEVLFLSAKGELKEQFKRHVVWQYYNDAFELRFKNAFKIIALVKRICQERKPDVVIAWSLGFSHWVALGARGAGVKSNLAHAGNPVGRDWLSKYIHTWISVGLGALAGNKVVACSTYVMRSFTSIPLINKRQFHSVYNCCQVEKFISGRDYEKEDAAIMVGTLERHKDHETLLKAWKILEEKGVRIPLSVAGDGSLRGHLEKMKHDLQLKYVVFLGSRDDIPRLLKQTRMFVFSTTSQEGFGTVLVEALAAGCQIIATRVAACEEVLDCGRYGLLVAPNDPEALAQAVIECLRGPVNGVKTDERLNYACKFSPAEMIRQYTDIASLD